MTTFGLITEGKTDQIVIENILAGYFDDPDIMVNWLLPLRDETDRHRVENYSNWYKVFEYCKSPKFKEALQFNNYIIVQIDTDVSEEKHYDISKYENGQELEPEELVARVAEKFRGLIGEDFCLRNTEKIIFAISVHSTECWLLPLYLDKKKSGKTKGCLEALNRQMQKTEKSVIDGKRKNPEIYEKISKEYCKHKTLMKYYQNNPSLKIFIDEIKKRNIVMDTDDDDF